MASKGARVLVGGTGKYVGHRGVVLKVSGTADNTQWRVLLEGGASTWTSNVQVCDTSVASEHVCGEDQGDDDEQGCVPFAVNMCLTPTPSRTTPIFNSTAPPPTEHIEQLVDLMPSLAGRPLEVPSFHRTNWRPGQRFQEQDDPDRTRQPWAAPAFIEEQDPRELQAKITVEELAVRNAKAGSCFAKVVRSVLSEENCAALLSKVNAKGFTPALLNVGMGQQQLRPEVRDGHRVIVDSPCFASWLLEVLRPHLPEQLPDGSRLEGLNERLRFLCYTPGQSFDEHFDGMYRRPHGHPKAGDRSVITVQLYLNDVPEELGGATTFDPSRAEAIGYQPEAGSVLLFTQNLSHEGSLLRNGLKYTLRTEVMYTRRQKDFEEQNV